MARIAVAGFRHETNTFAPAKANLTDFEQGYSWPPLTRGSAVAKAVQGYNLALAGFIEAAEQAGHEVVPLLWASASPSAYVEERAYERIAGMLVDALQDAAPVDAIYLSLHGAMVTEHLEDAEADIIKRCRDALNPLGWRIPLVVTLDYHANISPGLEREHGVLLTFAGGFPAADIHDCGPSVVAYGPSKAACLAAVDALAEAVIAAEPEFTGALLGPAEAVAKALAHPGPGPVVIADVQDNPGAGGTADTMGLLKALVAADAPGSVCGMIFDPHVASLASKSGEGTEITAALGGKHGVPGDSPLTATFQVEKVGDGLVDCEGPLYKGAHMELAPMALLRLGQVRIVVCGKKVQAADLAFFRHLGVEPAEART